VRRRRASRLAAVLALVVTVAASTAHAWDPVELLGITPRGTGLAGALTAGAADAAAAFFNPAGAAAAPGPEVALGWSYGWMGLRLDRQDARVTDAHGAHLGLVLPLRLGDFAVGVGVGIYVPDQHVFRIQLTPPSEPHFGLLDNNPQRLIANVVVGARWRWLALGVGVSVLADAGGRGVTFDVGLSGGEKVGRASLDYGLPTRVAPLAGLLVAPTARLKLGLTYRHDLDLRLAFDVLANVDVAGVVTGDAVISLRATNFFTPKKLAFGGQLELRDDLRVLLDVVWFRWSEMSGGTPDLRVLVRLGVSPPLVQAIFPPDGYRDTVSFRGGVEYERPLARHHRLRLRAGLAWEPTPVPDQHGLTSVADNDRLVVAAGAGLDLRDRSGLLRRPVSLEAGLQWHHLLERTTLKSDVALSRGFTSGGDVVVVTVGGTVRF
jgi:long-chain fatty acid transport protein